MESTIKIESEIQIKEENQGTFSDWHEQNIPLQRNISMQEDIQHNSQINREVSHFLTDLDQTCHTRRENNSDPSKDQSVSELQALLISWNQEHLLEHLIGEKVFPVVLRVIKRHHIERLLKNFDLGTQIIFEHNLEEWRQQIGLPLEDRACSGLHSFSRPSNSSTFEYGPVDSPGQSSTRQPSHPGTTNVTLSQILNQSSRARMLLDYYKNYLKFEEEQRNILISVIARHFEENNIGMSLKASYQLEQEILERFPSEKLEYYRTAKRGKIYNKARNSTVYVKNAFPAYSKQKSKNAKSTENKNRRLKMDFVPEEDAEDTIKSLEYDKLSSEEFDRCWKACTQYRLNDISQMESTSAILEKWTFYKQPSGFRLIDMDFNASQGNKNDIMQSWNTVVDKIINFLTDGNIKDRTTKMMLEKLKSQDADENCRDAVVLLALHAYFVPTNKIIKKDVTGKASTTKFTIGDSQNSFLFIGKSSQEVEDWINFLASKKAAVPPFVYAIGEGPFAIKEIYVYFHGIRYKFFNLLRAVDICLKTVYVFNLSFPQESVMFWTFIESFFYEYPTAKTFTKVFILNEHLSKT